jgi:hypothetical protein
MKPVQIEYTLDAAQLEQPVDVILNVTYFHETKPNRRSWDSDMDYYGYCEVEFNILNADGTPAPELDAMLSKAEIKYVEEKIIEEMSEEA